MRLAWRARRVRRRRRDFAFFEFVAILFFFGVLLEMLFVSRSASGGMGWLWMMPTIGGLIGILWLVAREPTNL